MCRDDRGGRLPRQEKALTQRPRRGIFWSVLRSIGIWGSHLMATAPRQPEQVQLRPTPAPAVHVPCGPEDVRTTMIYTHVLNKGGHGVRSPVDGL